MRKGEYFDACCNAVPQEYYSSFRNFLMGAMADHMNIGDLAVCITTARLLLLEVYKVNVTFPPYELGPHPMLKSLGIAPSEETLVETVERITGDAGTVGGEVL